MFGCTRAVLVFHVIALINITVLVTAQDELSWNYYGENGPSNWGDLTPLCSTGTRQSPVSIDTKNVIKNYLPPLRFYNYHIAPNSENLLNQEGRLLELTVNSQPRRQPFLLNTPFNNDTYIFLQMHFHWGSVNTQGSEHALDNMKFPMEAHLVHFNAKYGTAIDANNQPDGILVLAFFFKLQSADNPQYSALINALPNVAMPNQNAEMSPVVSISGLLPKDRKKYYYYRGSFATPDCAESNTYLIFKKMIGISATQLMAFRSLQRTDGAPLQDNFRPLQPLNGRMVYCRFGSNKRGKKKKIVRTRTNLLSYLFRRVKEKEEKVLSNVLKIFAPPRCPVNTTCQGPNVKFYL